MSTLTAETGNFTGGELTASPAYITDGGETITYTLTYTATSLKGTVTLGIADGGVLTNLIKTTAEVKPGDTDAITFTAKAPTDPSTIAAPVITVTKVTYEVDTAPAAPEYTGTQAAVITFTTVEVAPAAGTKVETSEDVTYKVNYTIEDSQSTNADVYVMVTLVTGCTVKNDVEKTVSCGADAAGSLEFTVTPNGEGKIQVSFSAADSTQQ